MDEAVLQRVIKIFAEFKKIPAENITPEMTFDELGLDSLDGLNLVFELEEEFGLMVPDDKVKEMRSVRQVAEGIEYLLAHPEEQANNVRPPSA
jgi:acyl carrier protein